MAMSARELNTAQDAFAAIEEVDKLHFVLKVQATSPLMCSAAYAWQALRTNCYECFDSACAELCMMNRD
jgi:hypothetical protein